MGLSIDFSQVARQLGLSRVQVESVVALADEGNTVPFITRYRKERTGHLDEQQIRDVLETVGGLRQLADRANTILRMIDTQGKLTPELRQAIEAADSLKRLEDLYLPYKPKKRTRAAIARERGLEPLANRIWQGELVDADLAAAAQAFVDPSKDLPATDEVIQGAADILAERISEVAEVRESARKVAWQTGKLTGTATDASAASAQAYRDYFDHSEAVTRLPPHRVLAFNRGESAGALRVRFEWDDAQALAGVSRQIGLTEHRCPQFLTRCATDALNRLIQPSLEREVRRELTEQAEAHAVGVFARNLRNLLLQPPLRGQNVLAIDPGFRTGCKVVVLDRTGIVLARDVVYVTGSAEKRAAAKARLAELLRTHEARLLAIGNGTACRESEELVAETIAEHVPDARYVIVNEAGASIYSTSPAAREEFPDDDATVRGTISIGRRLQDPLSELVKIDPQHIGVGMYQHDVNGKRLRESLDQVIESCVNFVGVDLNTASASLLGYVSGLNQLTARRLVEWRTQHGPFKTRRQLLKVAGIGQATFTQAAGFLKIADGDEPLDSTWIHPESYGTAQQLLSRFQESAAGTTGQSCDSPEFRTWVSELAPEEVSRELQVGEPTLRDMIDALARPGRDPRADSPGPIFKKGILKMEDLDAGLELQGTVLNVVDFGAFVDIGLKESGLVHVSQLAARYIRSPHDVVSVGDVVTVWVMNIDQERKRVSLTMVRPGTPVEQRPRRPESASASRPAPVPRAAPAATSTGAAGSATTRPATPRPARGSQGHKPGKKPAQPATPLSAAAKRGEEPLRSFDQLKQLWKEKEN